MVDSEEGPGKAESITVSFALFRLLRFSAASSLMFTDFVRNGGRPDSEVKLASGA